MITGHLATTLVAKREAPTMPWWLLAFAALLNDLAMFIFIGVGIEKMEHQPEANGPRLATTLVEMTYSHDALPQLLWIGLSGVVAFAFSRVRKFALVAMFLTAGHWVCDLVSGYGHFVFGTESAPLGTDWYRLNLPAALAVEAVLGLGCVYWFTRGQSFAAGKTIALYVVFGVLPFACLFI